MKMKYAWLRYLGSFMLGFSFTLFGMSAIGGFLGWIIGMFAAVSVFILIIGWTLQ